MQDQDQLEPETDQPRADATLGDDDIRTVVRRLSRPHKSGGRVIERAAILAEGSSSTAIMEWIDDHDGLPEEVVVKAPTGGLHGGRGETRRSGLPQRYVVPARAFE